MVRRNLEFWKRVVEYRVFNAHTVRVALEKAKVDFPNTEVTTDAANAYKRLEDFDLKVYRNSLQSAIVRSKEVIKAAV